MDDQRKTRMVRQYFKHLTASNIEDIVGMFGENGHVNSPFLGRVEARPFFEKLGNASSGSVLTVFDVLLGENGDSAAAYFQYDWTLASGEELTFQGVDYFKFDGEGKFHSMSIFYDTHPLREEVGDKYANA